MWQLKDSTDGGMTNTADTKIFEVEMSEAMDKITEMRDLLKFCTGVSLCSVKFALLPKPVQYFGRRGPPELLKSCASTEFEGGLFNNKATIQIRREQPKGTLQWFTENMSQILKDFARFVGDGAPMWKAAKCVGHDSACVLLPMDTTGPAEFVTALYNQRPAADEDDNGQQT